MESFQESTPGYQAYPEGGMKAYGVVLGAWLTLFPASGLLNSTGILQAWLFENQLKSYTESEISWIFSTFAFLFFLGGFIIGPLFDKYGSKIMLPVGALGLVVSLSLTSQCILYYQFILAFGCLGGSACSILWTTSIATIGHWYDQNRGLATGIATTAGGFGGVTFPVIFSMCVNKIGFAWSLICFAIISAGCLVIGILLLRTRIPSNPRASLIVDWRGFRDFRFVLTMSAIFVLDWAVLVPPAYITTYARSTGSQIISNHILMILNAASIIGRAFPGLIADRIGRFNIMIVCSAVSTASIFGLWLNANSNVSVLVLFAVLYGLFSGPAYSLTPVCVAQLCRPDEYASKYGTAYGVVSFATLAGVPVSGSILDVGNGKNYSALISFCGAAYATSTMLFVFARGQSIGWKLKAKF